MSDDAPRLALPPGVRERIVGLARAGTPNEVCGVFGGEFGPETSRVTSVYPAENAAETPATRYRIDPEEQLAIFERLEGRGEEIVGFYHSHPRGPPAPSATDVEAAAWPDRSYVIVSLPAAGTAAEEPVPVVRSWRWRADRGEFERESVVSE
ncbi:desampylase [Natrononativus amylolyticus]|uniref:desampylase n=1 Tax=Natrononativus amylolyticus TaxID=2963434 RepID=UPI0020CC0F06|nr:desampylase [Natrononativus amylolyticus]